MLCLLDTECCTTAADPERLVKVEGNINVAKYKKILFSLQGNYILGEDVILAIGQ